MYRMAERLMEETGQMQEQMNREARGLHIKGITPDGKLGPASVELDKAITTKKKPQVSEAKPLAAPSAAV
jgi:dihydroxyacetone kinase DhaKLM complex PTS-EIIA-like component DhaM